MTTALRAETCRVLITGGSKGIGLGLARRFLGAGAKVVVTGRSIEQLEMAAAANPGLGIIGSDVADPVAREQLAEDVLRAMPDLNVVVNNAGIQRRVALASDTAQWRERQAEIDTLLSGPVHLNHLLLPGLLRRRMPALIVNVTSGGAYVPQPFAPIYSACKAALHSYTVNLRFALSHTHCRVVELIPPAVRTTLAGPGATHGAPLDEFCDSVFEALLAGDRDEIGFGMTATAAFQAPKRLYETMFDEFFSRFPVERYG